MPRRVLKREREGTPPEQEETEPPAAAPSRDPSPETDTPAAEPAANPEPLPPPHPLSQFLRQILRMARPQEPAPSAETRRAIVTVNYVVGELELQRTGLVVLVVPNVPLDQEVLPLTTFATMVAIRTFVSRESWKEGVAAAEFAKLPVVPEEEAPEEVCAVCYDEYEWKPERQHEPSRKRRRVDAGGSAEPESAPADAYLHTPVMLPCKHTFGQLCMAEWLRSNTTCPLCRTPVQPPSHRPLPLVTVLLPNLLRYYASTTERQRQTPRVVVLQDDATVSPGDSRRLAAMGILLAVRSDELDVAQLATVDPEGAGPGRRVVSLDELLGDS